MLQSALISLPRTHLQTVAAKSCWTGPHVPAVQRLLTRQPFSLSRIILIQFTTRLKCSASFNCFEGANWHGICECVVAVAAAKDALAVAVGVGVGVGADAAGFILALLN